MTVTKRVPEDAIPANIAQEQKLHAESKKLKPGEEDLYRIWQGQASPFSYKVMTFMNYKGIAYKKVRATLQELPWADKVAGQSIVPIMLAPDGQVMQDGNTSDMIFPVAELISYLSTGATLLPGSVILTGTPSGVGFTRKPPVFLMPGDTVEVTVEGIGTLSNPVELQK